MLCHPFVVGELALGSLRDRGAVLAFLAAQRQAVLATHADVMTVVDHYSIFSMGIGYTDAHLLTSTLLDRRSSLWTRDKRLAAAAHKVGAVLYSFANTPDAVRSLRALIALLMGIELQTGGLVRLLLMGPASHQLLRSTVEQYCDLLIFSPERRSLKFEHVTVAQLSWPCFAQLHHQSAGSNKGIHSVRCSMLSSCEPKFGYQLGCQFGGLVKSINDVSKPLVRSSIIRPFQIEEQD